MTTMSYDVELPDEMLLERIGNGFATISFEFSKFRHLWNLLSRSMVYASSLLSLIEAKQRKRNKVLRRNKNKLSNDLDQSSSETVMHVTLLMKELVDSVVEELDYSNTSKLFQERIPVKNQPVYVHNLLAASSLSELEKLGKENDASISLHDESNISESTNIDSGFGGSTVIQENMSSATLDKQAFLCSLDDDDFQENEIQFFTCSMIDDVCTEEHYIKSLNERRGCCSSPSVETIADTSKSSVAEIDLSDTTPKITVVRKSITSEDNVNDTTFLICEEQPTCTSVAKTAKDTCLSFLEKDSPNALPQNHVTSNEELKEKINEEVLPIKSKDFVEKNQDTNEPEEMVSESSFCLRCNSSIPDQIQPTNEDGSHSLKGLPQAVPCPICTKLIAFKNVNQHLDVCSGVETKQDSLRKGSSGSHVFEARQKATNFKRNKNLQRKANVETVRRLSLRSSRVKLDQATGASVVKERRGKKINGHSPLPTGLDVLKTALENTLASNQLMTELVAQSVSNTISLKEEEGLPKHSDKSDNLKEIKKKPPITCQSSEISKDCSPKLPASTTDKLDHHELKSPVAEKNIATSEKESLAGCLDKTCNDNEHEVKSTLTRKCQYNMNKEVKEQGSERKKNILSKFKVKFRKSPVEKSKSLLDIASNNYLSSESEQEEDMEVDIPAEPTRRSSRTTRSRKSYCEISSEDEEKSHSETKAKLNPVQRKKLKKNMSDEEFDVKKDIIFHKSDNVQTSDEKANLNVSATGSDEEDGEVPDINVEELLSFKFHCPDASKVISLVQEFDGVRYYNGEVVDPAQPKLLTGGILREYQITGFQWLKLLFENGESGILADEMGLGKTVQCIAMICKLIHSGVKGPFLVCAPTSTIYNWFSEFKRFAPKVPVIMYNGTIAERKYLQQCFVDEVISGHHIVMITSYDILMRDKVALNSYVWDYFILDEGHRVKNLKSKTFKELKSLLVSSRVMLTGTPLQNNLEELWSLLNFLLPEVFDDIYAFESWFDVDFIKANEKVLSILHQILTPFLLRRVKADVEVKIPPKREMLVMVPLAPLQDMYYRATIDKSIVRILKNKEYYNVTPGVADPDILASHSQEENNTEKETRSMVTRSRQANTDVTACVKKDSYPEVGVYDITLNNMMMQLRKCCNHPYLIQFPCTTGSDKLLVDEKIVSSCGKVMLLDRMLPLLKERGHKVLLFSQMTVMLDILEEYCNMRKYSFLRFDGSTSCEERFRYIQQFNEDPNVFIFLLSTRAGGLGINLTGADTVIIYDSDWNPQNDLQAQDRCHRIGQEKPVVVYRLVTMGTIDQEIVQRAAMKKKLEKMIMHKEKFKGHLKSELNNCKVITPEELLKLLESNTNISVAEDKESVINDVDLARLLDRSDLCSPTATEEMEWITISSHKQVLKSPSATTHFRIIDNAAKEKNLFL